MCSYNFIVVVGEREMATETVQVRPRDQPARAHAPACIAPASSANSDAKNGDAAGINTDAAREDGGAVFDAPMTVASLVAILNKMVLAHK